MTIILYLTFKGEMDDDEFVQQLLEEFDKEFWEAMGHIR